MTAVQQMHFERSGRVLGSGSTGTVSFGTLKVGPAVTPVAIKSATGPNTVVLHREGEFLNHLRGCPQVVQSYGGNFAYDDACGVSYDLFLEFAPDGSLYDFLQLSPMYECYARRFTRSMLRGLAHIHRRGVVHCDVKPANVLLWNEKEVKIADFGSALWSCEENSAFPCRGTPYYLAPECLAKNEYGAPADVWALGCTVAEMFTCRPARGYLAGFGAYAMMEMIAHGEAMPEIPEDVSEVGKDFLRRCFEVEPRKRWTAEMLLKHPFATNDGVDGKCSPEQSAWEEKVAEILQSADRPEQEPFANLLPVLEDMYWKVFDVRLSPEDTDPCMRACMQPIPPNLPVLSCSF